MCVCVTKMFLSRYSGAPKPALTVACEMLLFLRLSFCFCLFAVLLMLVLLLLLNMPIRDKIDTYAKSTTRKKKEKIEMGDCIFVVGPTRSQHSTGGGTHDRN